MPGNCLYAGDVMHRRLRPFGHRFVYRVFSIMVDIDELPALGRRLRLFAHNGRGLVSLRDRDHGPRDGSPLRPWVEKACADAGVDVAGGRIFLHCFPRVLGLGFDPLSTYWCHGPGGDLRAILYEVKNTFGDQHGYLVPIAAAPAPGATLRHARDKVFHVSPFIGMSARYAFRVRVPEEELFIAINESGPDGPILVATHRGRRMELDDARLLRCFLAYPFLSLKVLGGIHWQALKLWLKGAQFHSRPQPPGAGVSA